MIDDKSLNFNSNWHKDLKRKIKFKAKIMSKIII